MGRSKGGKKNQNNGKRGRSRASDTPRAGFVHGGGQPTARAHTRAEKLRELAHEKQNGKKDEKPEKKVEEKPDLPPPFERDKGSKKELRFSPKAMAKTKWLRDRGDTEISVFGLSRLDDLLYVEDVRLVKQKAGGAHFDFDDEALNEYLFDMLQEGWQPVECMRIWIHTHPGGASPSGTDRSTFKRTTGEADWGIMCIIGKDDETSALLRGRMAGYQYDATLDVVIDFSGPFEGVTEKDADAWEEEYQACVEKERYTVSASATSVVCGGHGKYTPYEWSEYYHETGQTEGYPDKYGPGSWHDDDDKDMPRLPKTMAEKGSPTTQEELEGVETRFFGAQMVHVVEDDAQDNATTVITDRYWFTYDIEDRVYANPGEEVSELDDIAFTDPLMWGEAKWDIDDKGNPTVEKLSYFDSETDSFVMLDETDSKGKLVMEELRATDTTKKAEPKKEEKKEEKPVVRTETVH